MLNKISNHQKQWILVILSFFFLLFQFSLINAATCIDSEGPVENGGCYFNPPGKLWNLPGVFNAGYVDSSVHGRMYDKCYAAVEINGHMMSTRVEEHCCDSAGVNSYTMIHTCADVVAPGSICIDGACTCPTSTCQYSSTCAQTGSSFCGADCSRNTDGNSCDDGNPCTYNDHCSSGSCTGTPYTCNDGKSCTTDRCNGDGTCTYSVKSGYCLIDGTCYPRYTVNPSNPCQECRDDWGAKTYWSNDNTNTCNDGNACTYNDHCSSGSCIGISYDCNDGVSCTVDSCNGDGTCTNTPNDNLCNSYDITGVSTCTYSPDDKSFTWDFRQSFNSHCNPITGCSIGDSTITHVCNISACGAECESDLDCPDKCVSGVFYYAGSCTLSSCSCSYSTQDCDLLDVWVDNGNTQWVELDECNEKEQKQQDFRDYSCSVSGCHYSVTDKRWVDSGSTRPKAETTVCSSGVCRHGVCVSSTPKTTNFPTTYGSTDFSVQVDLRSVPNLILATNFGSIEFPLNYTVNTIGENYDKNVIFGDCYVSVNSSALDYTFNATAYLTLNNSDGHCGDDRIYYAPGVYDNADAIRQHDTVCKDCIKLIADNHKIKFRVFHFSSYAIGSNANLTIYDNYEDSSAQPNATITFYANYTNKSGSLISGATCTIYFDGNTTDKHNMTDNGNNYNYTSSFSSAGTHNYNITCSASGYNTLSAVDDVNVGSEVVPEFNSFILILLLAFSLIIFIAKRIDA